MKGGSRCVMMMFDLGSNLLSRGTRSLSDNESWGRRGDAHEEGCRKAGGESQRKAKKENCVRHGMPLSGPHGRVPRVACAQRNRPEITDVEVTRVSKRTPPIKASVSHSCPYAEAAAGIMAE